MAALQEGRPTPTGRGDSQFRRRRLSGAAVAAEAERGGGARSHDPARPSSPATGLTTTSPDGGAVAGQRQLLARLEAAAQGRAAELALVRRRVQRAEQQVARRAARDDSQSLQQPPQDSQCSEPDLWGTVARERLQKLRGQERVAARRLRSAQTALEAARQQHRLRTPPGGGGGEISLS
jgi:hypothetical protein